MSRSVDNQKLPRHIAIIMDGNGRWATQKGEARSKGHIAGVDALYRTIEEAAQIGIEYLTVYAFSSENWQRPTEEVDALMQLMAQSLEMYLPEFMKQGVRIKAIGDLERLPEYTRERLQDTIDKTANNKAITLVVALSYSSRWELNNAVHSLLKEIQGGSIKLENLLNDPVVLEPYLVTNDIPDPDLLIRTGGELRISNFLMYQVAYSELFFTNTLWPDFGRKDLEEAIASFSQRERRFGKVLNNQPSN